MGTFYLDTEFTNDNYDLTDIIKIALNSGGKWKHISHLREGSLLDVTYGAAINK